jgi:hypothetical protein
MDMKTILPIISFLILFIIGCERTEKKEVKEDTSPKSTESANADKEQIKEKTTDEKNNIVARIDGRPIYEQDVLGRPFEAAINNEILYQIGLKQGLDKKYSGLESPQKKLMVINSVTAKLLNDLPQIEITDKEAEDFYNENKNRYVHVSVVKTITDDSNVAKEIHGRLMDGEDLLTIANAYKNSGANVKFLSMVTDMEKIKNYKFKKYEEGSIGEIIENGDVFEIYTIREIVTDPFSKSKRRIKHGLWKAKRANLYNNAFEDLKKENKIKVVIVNQTHEG